MIRQKIRKILSMILFLAILIQTAACGTILYPERRGQRHGQIDPAVVILDGICLIFFIVPGVVAFAVDFATGAIYLPKGKKSAIGFLNNDALEVADIDMAKVDIASIEEIVSKQTGKDIELDSGNVKTFKINDPDFRDKYFVKTSIN